MRDARYEAPHARLRANNGFQWLTFAPVSTKAADYFRVNESSINWLSTAFMFGFVVVSPYVVACTEPDLADARTGLRYGHSTGAPSRALLLRAFSCWQATGFAMQVPGLITVSLGSLCLARS